MTEEKLWLFIELEGTVHPYNRQTVEIAIKAVTQTSTTLCNKTLRKGFIKTQMASRKAVQKFDR